ncbi:O-antigen ligase domain-containing protein [Burkholderia sp. JP2-270]|uniref:O-antigen ligase family protein n=1 Tax=Burkholderia sp. JP2-270 TaxID=2217913 RepID=UPI000DA30FC2|nr:O-antigen ligase family protein [Burkholderia sp. JP2-270]AWV05046.1 O-antigen ligase domain-containing protein [Burkholderia sp. JP2-270]
MPYISLIALYFSVTNLVPVSAIGFAPIVFFWWRFFGRTYPDFIGPLLAFSAYALASTLIYDPASLLEYDFYRYDGNFFVSYAPIFAGCVYTHRWDLNKTLKWFFISAVFVNLPYYAWYLMQNSLLSIFIHPADTFGSYFIARNAAGGFLAMLFCLGVACYMNDRSRVLLALLGLNFLMLVSTYSRGSMVGVGVMLLYLSLGRRRWILALMIAIFIAASIAIAIHYTNPNVDYMGYAFTINDPNPKAGNLQVRYEWLWPRALAYFLKSPIFGLGFGSFDDQIPQVINYFGLFGQPVGSVTVHSDSHAHNSYMSFLAELGIVGLFLVIRFYWVLISWCQRGAAFALENGRFNFVPFRFVELSAVCVLAMATSEHRLTTPSNVLILSLVLSLLVASRAGVGGRPARHRSAVAGEPT